MLLKRIDEICDYRDWYYRVNLNKCIHFKINRDHSIELISLVDIESNEPSFRHEVKSLCYMESLTKNDFDLLDTDELLELARWEDNNA